MIPNDQPSRKQTISTILVAIHDYGHVPLTPWEEEFINSIYEQFDEKGDLSNKQCEILERIYDK